jgi:hypothetical protein
MNYDGLVLCMIQEVWYNTQSSVGHLGLMWLRRRTCGWLRLHLGGLSKIGFGGRRITNTRGVDIFRHFRVRLNAYCSFLLSSALPPDTRSIWSVILRCWCGSDYMWHQSENSQIENTSCRHTISPAVHRRQAQGNLPISLYKTCLETDAGVLRLIIIVRFTPGVCEYSFHASQNSTGYRKKIVKEVA